MCPAPSDGELCSPQVVSYLHCVEWPNCNQTDFAGRPARVVGCLHDHGHVIPSWGPELFYNMFLAQYVNTNNLGILHKDTGVVTPLVLDLLVGTAALIGLIALVVICCFFFGWSDYVASFQKQVDEPPEPIPAAEPAKKGWFS